MDCHGCLLFRRAGVLGCLRFRLPRRGSLVEQVVERHQKEGEAHQYRNLMGIFAHHVKTKTEMEVWTLIVTIEV